jgi:hypothetical protein
MRPPDGHWHRRGRADEEHKKAFGDGSQRFNCVVEDCGWFVIERNHEVVVRAGEAEETPMEATKRLHALSREANLARTRRYQAEHGFKSAPSLTA